MLLEIIIFENREVVNVVFKLVNAVHLLALNSGINQVKIGLPNISEVMKLRKVVLAVVGMILKLGVMHLTKNYLRLMKMR